MEAIPTPTPPIPLNMTNWLNESDRAHPMAERAKKIPAMSRIFFLPYLSLRIPVTETPKIVPTSAELTYHPSQTASRLNCDFTNPMVPEIMAVSYPNKKPPRAAMSAKKVTLFFI